jgi:polysaccharide biosynthesis/export protein
MRLNTIAPVGFVVLSVVGSLTTWAADPPKPGVSPEYRIGPSDVISVQVYKEGDASTPSGGVLVRSDGMVTLPLVDDVYVQGMTTGEVKKELTKRLATLIPGADVSVRVEQSHSKRVFLDGKVRRVGPIELSGPMTVVEAINTAGGFNDFARVDKILIMRTENGSTKKITFDYKAYKKGKVEQDILLQPGDKILVP